MPESSISSTAGCISPSKPFSSHRFFVHFPPHLAVTFHIHSLPFHNKQNPPWIYSASPSNLIHITSPCFFSIQRKKYPNFLQAFAEDRPSVLSSLHLPFFFFFKPLPPLVSSTSRASLAVPAPLVSPTNIPPTPPLERIGGLGEERKTSHIKREGSCHRLYRYDTLRQ